MMQYKVSPIYLVWSPINGPLIKLWKANPDGSPKLPTGVPSHVLYHPIWGNDALKLMQKEKFISFGLSKYMDSKRWALHKIPHMKWRLSCTWSTMKMFCCICQNYYCFKVQLFWRASGLQAIGGLIIVRLHCQLWWMLLIQKIQFEFLIVGQRTWNL